MHGDDALTERTAQKWFPNFVAEIRVSKMHSVSVHSPRMIQVISKTYGWLHHDKAPYIPYNDFCGFNGKVYLDISRDGKCHESYGADLRRGFLTWKFSILPVYEKAQAARSAVARGKLPECHTLTNFRTRYNQYSTFH
ncbi:unnamed protein product [Nezara viridula]|uniref:Uncharacterized protein n=1 Tax=Nezara viridula TaxID=85310 RepID=A0A9P0HHY5_NEZVI|nr:unnamed protein product [Nezara viridula]